MKLSNHEYELDFENIFSNYGLVKIKLNISFNGRIIRSILVGKSKNKKFATHQNDYPTANSLSETYGNTDDSNNTFKCSRKNVIKRNKMFKENLCWDVLILILQEMI